MYETSPKGDAELEQFIDATPVLALDLRGERTWQPRFTLQTEYEYGITDKLELGLYLQFSNNPADGSGAAPLFFDGVKQRLRYRLAEAGEWPVDVALYFEIAELRNELELEAKVILQRQFGPVRAVVNLWGERELYFDGTREWVLNPTAGATWQLTPSFHLGLEYWMRAEFPDEPVPGAATFNLAPHHFVGPAALWQLGRLWWSTAVYVRTDGFDRPAQEGDIFGRVWVRTILGLSL
jgi:hypothetical protein